MTVAVGNGKSAQGTTTTATKGGGMGRHHGGRKAVAALSAVTLAILGLAFNVPTALAVPPFPIWDDTQGPTGGFDPSWSYARSGTGNTGATYTSDGWLRLTNANLNQATNLLNTTAFPSDTGFQVSFDYRQAGGRTFNSGTGLGQNTGDGISMYLVVGSSGTVAVAGGQGAGLGYSTQGTGQASTATTCTIGGVPGGYLGLGLDVYGNFASPNFGSTGGSRFQPYGGAEIGLRGSGSGCTWNSGATGNVRYPWVAGTSYDLWTGTGGGTNDPATYESNYRRVTITIVPSGTNVQATVAISGMTTKSNPNSGAMTTVFSSNLSNVNGQMALPPMLQLGFAASTGSASDYHDIRNIRVSALSDIGITKTLSTATPGTTGYPAGTFVPGAPISFTLTATNYGPSEIGDAPDGVARIYDDLSALPISNVSWTCAASSGAACANGSGGTGSIVSQDWTGVHGSTVTVTVSGTVTAHPGNYTNTAILPNDFVNNTLDPNTSWAQKDGGVIDTDPSNNSSSASFTVVAPHFTQTKTADTATYVVGQPITYDVVVRNDGTSAGTAAVTDLVPATVTVSNAVCQGAGGATCTVTRNGNNVSGTIDAPINGSATFRITGTVAAGPTVTNTATVDVTTPTCTPAVCGGGDATTSVLTVTSPALTIVKTAQIGGLPASTLVVGQTIDYQYLITNSGDTRMTGVTVNEVNFTGHDPLSAVACPTTAAGWPSGVVGALAQGQAVTCTASYVVVQADVDAKSVTNTATAVGTPQGLTTPIESPPSTVTVGATVTSGLAVTKSADLSGLSSPMRAGDPIIYTVTAQNTGGVTLHDVALTDSLAGLPNLTLTWPGAAGILTPGQTVTGKATYTLTQADIDAGTVSNTAVGTAKDPQDQPLTDQATVTTDLTGRWAPAIAVTKMADVSGLSTPVAPGDPVVYTVTARNTGNVTLHGVSISDTLAGLPALTYTWPGPAGTLAPGQTVTATATYALTQADIDSGVVSNTATGTGQDPQNHTVTDSATVVTNVMSPPAAIAVTKTADISGLSQPVQAGDPIVYTITARNTSTVSLHDVAIADSLPGLPALTYTWPGTAGLLAPGQTVTATATYRLTQADIDAGTVSNTATVTGKDPQDQPVTGQDTVTTDLTALWGPAVSVTKTADVSGLSSPIRVGDPIAYSVLVRNTGDVTLHNLVVTDQLAGVTVTCPTALNWPGGVAGVLAPNAAVTCTASYALTQADLDAGDVINTAKADGQDPAGRSVSGQDTVTTPLATTPAGLTVTKIADLSGLSAIMKPGDPVVYTVTATNSSNVTLHDVAITDSLPGLPALTYTWPGTDGILAPGQTVTGTATYALTQADIDAGQIVNTAIANALDPQDNPVTGQASVTTDLTTRWAASLAVTKTADLSGFSPTVTAGDQIAYTVTVRNSGNVTLHDVAIDDAMTFVAPLVYTWPGTPGTLAPGQTMTARASYAVTQADIDAGTVSNTAIANALDPRNNPVTGSDTVVSPLASQGNGLTMTKVADLTGVSHPVKAGDPIVYTVTATNSSNVTLHSVTITDSLPGLPALTYTWPGTAGTLTPGQTVTGTATYHLTQADIDAGTLTNTATGNALDPQNNPVTGQASVTTDLSALWGPALSVTKTADLSGFSPVVQAGDPIVYTVTASNTGDVTLHDVAITDSLPGLPALTYTWPGTAGVLAPGQTVTATATYVLTQAILDAGTVSNTAVGTGKDPQDNPVTDQASVTTDLTQYEAANLTVVKTANLSALSTPVVPGNRVAYSIAVTNSGDVTIHDLVVSDLLTGVTVLCPAASLWPSGTAGVLAPATTVTCTASYVLTQADIDAGRVVNTAKADGKDPRDQPVSGQDQVITDLTDYWGPALSVVKTADISGLATIVQVGDPIAYTVKVTNSGDVTLHDVTLTDALPGLSSFVFTWPGTAGILGPGQTATATATYNVTQADIDADRVTNTAIADGKDPQDQPVTGQDRVTTRLGTHPYFTQTKSADAASYVIGQAITYTVTVNNIGSGPGTADVTDAVPATVTLTDVSCQATPAGATCDVDNTGNAVSGHVNLPAGGQAVFTITGRVAAGPSVANTVVVTPTEPGCEQDDSCGGGPGPTPPIPVLTPALTLVKTATVDGTPTGPLQAGQTVTYHFAVTNTGETPLSDLRVVEGAFSGSGSLSAPACPTAAADWPSGQVGLLDLNQTVTCTAGYTLTQADVDAGGVTNTATAEGTPPGVDTPVVSPPDSVTVTIDAGPNLSVVKTADVTSLHNPAQVGDQIGYTVTVKNTGSVTLSDVSITDDLPGLSNLAYVWPTGSTATTGVLTPGSVVTMTAKYALTQDDLDAGQVVNTALATGTPPPTPAEPNPQPIPPVSGEVTTDLTDYLHPALTVVKASDTTQLHNPAQVGDLLSFTVKVTNTGNVTLHDVTVTDDLAGLSTPTFTWPGATGVLRPGQQVVVTATYPLTQADLDAAKVVNTAIATGTPPPTPTNPTPQPIPPVSDEVTTDLTDFLQPGLTTVKTADQAGLHDPAQVGDVIAYTITALNSGNVTLHDVTISDTLPGLSDLSYRWPDGSTAATGTLSPGQTVTATASLTVTQAQIDTGRVVNTALAKGTPPVVNPANPPEPIEQPSDAVPVDLNQNPMLSLVKTGALPTGDVTPLAGDVVTYRFVVTNTGNVTLHNVSVTDAMPGLATPTYDWPGTPGTLAPGQAVTATAEYTLTQLDVDAGDVANQARATGTPPSTDRSPSPDPINTDDSTEVTLPAGAALQLGLVATSGGQPVTEMTVGQLVQYIYSVKNTGNVTVSDLTIDTRAFDGSGTLGEIMCPSAPLVPGQTVSCTATYTVTQADVNAGDVTNTAVAQGLTPAQAAVESNPATAQLNADQAPGLALFKTGALADGATGRAGDVINYRFEVTNTGNITLTNVTISDQLDGLSDIVYRWQNVEGVLQPGEQAVATATYVLTQADVDAGGVHNKAVVSGVPQGCPAVGRDCTPTDGDSETDVPVVSKPGLSMTKSADKDTYVQGTVITYSFTMTNTGNVTLTDVKPVEGAFNGSGPAPVMNCPANMTLAPYQQVVCTATYTATQADVAAGKLTNTAVAAGTPPDTTGGGNPGQTDSDPSTVTITAAPVKVQTGGAVMTASGGAGGGLALAVVLLGLGLVAVGLNRRSRRQPAALR